jgi:hypothetical protein
MTLRTFRLGTLLALSLAAVLLAGCDRVGGALGLTGTVGAVPAHPIGPERLRVSLPKTGAQAVLGPVSKTGRTTVWQTLDGITLAFRDGVLTGTRGLGDDLMSADVSGDLAMLRGVGANEYHPHIRAYLDGEDQTVYRSYQCRRTAQGRETTRDAATARRIGMLCTSPRDSFTNVYWLNGAGDVTKSRQWVSPTIGYMETERVAR